MINIMGNWNLKCHESVQKAILCILLQLLYVFSKILTYIYYRKSMQTSLIMAVPKASLGPLSVNYHQVFFNPYFTISI